MWQTCLILSLSCAKLVIFFRQTCGSYFLKKMMFQDGVASCFKDSKDANSDFPFNCVRAQHCKFSQASKGPYHTVFVSPHLLDV